MSKAIPHGPFTITAKFAFINDTEDVAEADWTFPPGTLPTEEEVKAAFEETKTILPEGFHPIRREDYAAYVATGQAGSGFSVAGFSADYTMIPVDTPEKAG